MRLAFASPSWPPDSAANGVVTYVDQVTSALRRLGHRPSILSSTGEGEWPDVFFIQRATRPPVARLLDPLLFRIRPYAATRNWHAENLRRTALRAIAEQGTELLEMEEALGLLERLRPRLPIPVVVRLHGPCFASAAYTPHFRRRAHHEGRAIALADGVSAPSADILAQTRQQYQLPLDDAAVIPPPAPVVPPDRRWRLDACDHNRILFLGRFDRHKGGDVAIDALRVLVRDFPALRLSFVGTDARFNDDAGRSWSLAGYLQHRAPEVSARVDSLGRLGDSEVVALRRQAYLTIVPSRYETFGLVALEAMAHGCPLVAARTGGIAETVTDGVNGLLSTPGDPSSLAAQIALLLRDPHLAAQLGARAGEDAASQYHPDRIACRIAAFHHAVIERWNQRRAGAAA